MILETELPEADHFPTEFVSPEVSPQRLASSSAGPIRLDRAHHAATLTATTSILAGEQMTDDPELQAAHKAIRETAKRLEDEGIAPAAIVDALIVNGIRAAV